MTPLLGFVIALLVLAIVLAFLRLVRGPSIPDRVLALDLMTTTGMAVIAVFAVATEQVVILDVAIVLALVSFVGTIAFAYYLERLVR